MHAKQKCPGAPQGTFVECASPARVTLWLASAMLELVAAKEVHAHSQPFVRRSALIAASQARHSCVFPYGCSYLWLSLPHGASRHQAC